MELAFFELQEINRIVNLGGLASPSKPKIPLDTLASFWHKANILTLRR